MKTGHIHVRFLQKLIANTYEGKKAIWVLNDDYVHVVK